jgi:D-sedoheptulose 7-phosphate isomerase
MIRNYIEGLQTVIGALPVEEIGEVVRVLMEAKMKRRQVFIMGNGGSASTASHFASDLIRNTHQFRVISLTDNVPSMTAIANDQSYNDVFLFPLVSMCSPRDVVIAISASGRSKNVLRAVEFANQVSARTVGMTGFDGGSLGKIANIHVHVSCDVIEQVEDAHLAICHMVAKELREL